MVIAESESWLLDGVDIDVIASTDKFMAKSSIDLIFSNVYVNGEKLTLIDQEWLFESCLPLKFALFRAVYYFYMSDYVKLRNSFKVTMEEVF